MSSLMFTSPNELELSEDVRIELNRLSRSRTAAAAVVQRAQMILAMADGEPYSALTQRFNTSTTTLMRWRKRFLAETMKPPPQPLTHWTSRRLGKKLGYSHSITPRPTAAG